MRHDLRDQAKLRWDGDFIHPLAKLIRIHYMLSSEMKIGIKCAKVFPTFAS